MSSIQKSAVERPSSAWDGPSQEMRRFSAGIRVITAMLCTLLTFSSETQLSAAALSVFLAYDLWAAYMLWAEASARRTGETWHHYWIDVVWTTSVLHLTSSGSSMLIMTLVQPVVLTSIGYGVQRGLLLGLVAALAVLVDISNSSSSASWSAARASTTASGRQPFQVTKRSSARSGFT